MVLGLIMAGLSVAQGVMGFADAQNAKGEAKASGILRQAAATSQYAIRQQAIRVELNAAGMGASLLKKSSYLNQRAAILDMQAISAKNSAVIYDTLTVAENVRREYEAAALANEKNAKLERVAAKRAKSAADTDAQDFERSGNALLATNRAAQAASGLTKSGSLAKVDQDIVFRIMEGVARTKHAGDVKYFDYIISAEGLEKEVSDLRISKDASQAATATSIRNIDDSTKLQLRGAMLGYRAAQLQTTQAQNDLDIARQKASIDKQTAKTDATFATQNSRMQTSSEVRQANASGINSVLGAVTSLAGNKSVQGAFETNFETNFPTLATKSIFK